MYIKNQPVFVAESKNPEFLKNWRHHEYSLTEKLQAAKGNVQLEIISQQWTKPSWWDMYLLQIHDELIFQREIIMKHHEIEYWYARTIIPHKCYQLNPDFFNRLEKESVRNLIFDNSMVHRVTLLDYPIDNQCIEFNWVKRYLKTISGILWVRLAEYTIEYRESFFVVELLLPELENVS